jgi:hypothetical protein
MIQSILDFLKTHAKMIWIIISGFLALLAVILLVRKRPVKSKKTGLKDAAANIDVPAVEPEEPREILPNTIIVVKRTKSTSDVTIGKMYINGAYVCDTLEDPVRNAKIKGKTAIPTGNYKVTWHDSPKFKRKLPWLRNVPNYEYILIHSGNTTADTEGCILVGKWDGKESLTGGTSRPALQNVINLLQGYTEMTITVM